MGLLSYANQRDAIEREVIDTVVRIGGTVIPLNIRDGPDLVIGFRKVNFLIELKRPKGKLSKGQVGFHCMWRGLPIAVCRSVDEVLDEICGKSAIVSRDCR